MLPEEENYKLMWVLLHQKMVNGQLTGINWNAVADELGISGEAAARSRWFNLKTALVKEKGFTIPAPFDHEASTPKKKSAAPKKVKSTAPLPKLKSTPKKRKLKAEVDEDVEKEFDDAEDFDAEEL